VGSVQALHSSFRKARSLLKKGVVSQKLADQFYGSRLEKLLAVQTKEVKDIVAERDGRGWENFVYLWRMLQRARELPTPPSSSGGGEGPIR